MNDVIAFIPDRIFQLGIVLSDEPRIASNYPMLGGRVNIPGMIDRVDRYWLPLLDAQLLSMVVTSLP